MLVLDTNVYLDILNDPVGTRNVLAAVAEHPEPVGVSTVVLSELAIGVAPERREALLAYVTGDVEPAAFLTPTHADWMVAAAALRDLGGDAVTTRRSFWNDLLIAASCARVGAVLMTRNADDFVRIRRAIPVALVLRPD